MIEGITYYITHDNLETRQDSSIEYLTRETVAVEAAELALFVAVHL